MHPFLKLCPIDYQLLRLIKVSIDSLLVYAATRSGFSLIGDIAETDVYEDLEPMSNSGDYLLCAFPI